MALCSDLLEQFFVSLSCSLHSVKFCCCRGCCFCFYISICLAKDHYNLMLNPELGAQLEFEEISLSPSSDRIQLWLNPLTSLGSIFTSKM